MSSRVVLSHFSCLTDMGKGLPWQLIRCSLTTFIGATSSGSMSISTERPELALGQTIKQDGPLLLHVSSKNLLTEMALRFLQRLCAASCNPHAEDGSDFLSNLVGRPIEHGTMRSGLRGV